MEYRFEEMQPLMFVVYDVDNESPSLEDDDFLGQVEVTLGSVVSIGAVTRNLQHKNASGESKGDLGSITVCNLCVWWGGEGCLFLTQYGAVCFYFWYCVYTDKDCNGWSCIIAILNFSSFTFCFWSIFLLMKSRWRKCE